MFNMQYEAIPNWPRAYEKKKEALTANIQFFKAEHLQEAWHCSTPLKDVKRMKSAPDGGV